MPKEDKHESVQESGPIRADNGDTSEEISFNPNVFTEFKLAGNEEASIVSAFEYFLLVIFKVILISCFIFYVLGIHQEIAADEENVRKASVYLRDVVFQNSFKIFVRLKFHQWMGRH